MVKKDPSLIHTIDNRTIMLEYEQIMEFAGNRIFKFLKELSSVYKTALFGHLSTEEKQLVESMQKDGVIADSRNKLVMSRLLPSKGVDYFEEVRLENEHEVIRPKGEIFYRYLASNPRES